jgi:hypothetical protein
MTCECGHERIDHEGRCFAPSCTCDAFHEAGSAPSAEPANLSELFPPGQDRSILPIAVLYPSRSGGSWPHVVMVCDHPTHPFLMCSCRSFAVRGTCWAAARVTELTGIPAREGR